MTRFWTLISSFYDYPFEDGNGPIARAIDGADALLADVMRKARF